MADFYRLCLILCLLSFGSQKGSGALPPERTLRSAVAAGGTFVAVGESGTVLSSVGGGPSVLRDSGTSNALYSVAWGGGRFVAVGADGTLVSSPDAIQWTARRVTLRMAAPKLAYGNGRFVAMGKGKPGFWSVLTSANGIDWTPAELVASGNASTTNGLPFGGLAYGAGKFLAAGGVDSANLVLTSVDGLLWNEQGTIGAVGGNNGAIEGPVAYGGGEFIMGATYANHDEYGNFLGRYQGIVRSLDSVLWIRIIPPLNPIQFLSISDCGILVANTNLSTHSVLLGRYLPLNSTNLNGAFNGVWDRLDAPTPLSIHDVVSVDGKFVGVGSDVVDLNYASNGLYALIDPVASARLEGESVSFKVLEPCVALPRTYQWFFNSARLADATNATLELTNLKTNQAGIYTFSLRAGDGTVVTSRPAQLIVQAVVVPENPTPTPPTVISGTPVPTNQVWIGASISLSGAVSGWPPPSLQWFFNGTAIEGATNGGLQLFGVTSSSAGDYSLRARNSLGTSSGLVSRLEVRSAAPPDYTNELSIRVAEGANAGISFGAAPVGSFPTVLQVMKDGNVADLPLLTLGESSLFEVSPSDHGVYSMLGKNAVGQGSSSRVTLDVVPALPLEVWKQRAPQPRSLLEVTYGSAGFVAVGDQSSIATSANGRDWSFHRLPSAVDFRSVAFGNGIYVAAGEFSILTSRDGLHWNVAVNLGLFSPLESVVFAAGRFFAVGRTALFVSVDGLAWNPLKLPTVGLRQFSHLAFGNGVFVAVGGEVPIWTSGNGVDWVPRSTEIGRQLESIVFADGVFVTVGDEGAIWTSADGITWKERDSDTSNRLRGVAFGNGKFIAVGNRGRVLSASKISSWKKEDSGQPNRLESVVFAQGLFVAVGEDGALLYSTNGSAWSSGHPGPTRDLDGLATDSSRLLIVGKGGTILTTSNGVTFNRASVGLTNDLHGVGWSGNMYVAVGEPETILSSPDSVHWTVRNESTNSSLKSVRWAAGIWVAVGTQGAIWTSPDGISWTRRVSSTLNDLNDVAYGDGRFVVVGDNLPPNGTVLTSPDGVSWTRNNQYVGKNLRSVDYLNGVFIATANDGWLLVSTNGLQWEQRFTGYLNNLRAAGYAGGAWILVGNQGLILHSPDLSGWRPGYCPSTENLHQVRYLNSRFYAIGNRGTVVESDYYVRPPQLDARVLQEVLELSVYGDMGTSCRLEVSDRLPALAWTTLATFTLQANPQKMTDPEPARTGARFYRVVSP